MFLAGSEIILGSIHHLCSYVETWDVCAKSRKAYSNIFPEKHLSELTENDVYENEKDIVGWKKYR